MHAPVAQQPARRVTQSGRAQPNQMDELEPVHMPVDGVSQDAPGDIQHEVLSNVDSNKSKAAKKKNSNAKNARPTVLGLSHSVGGLSTVVNSLQESASVNSARTERLEDKMETFESKMDYLINFVTKDKSARNTDSRDKGASAPVSKRARFEPSSHVDNDCALVTDSGDEIEQLPPPAVLRREENRSGVIDEMLRREEYQPASGSGKHTKVSHDGNMPRPYMYIEKEGCDTLKDKLDARPSLSAGEYINAMLLLLDDEAAYERRDKHFIFKHILQVSTDSLARPWAGVRKWSVHIWDSVERGRCTWQDQGYIQDARIRISYTSGPVLSGSAPSAKKMPAIHTDPVYSVCREFNTASGCKHSGSHDSGHIRYLHVCAYCDAVGRKSSHSVLKCRTRGENSANQQSENRQWSQHNRNSNAGGHQSAYHAQGQSFRPAFHANNYSKNGQ